MNVPKLRFKEFTDEWEFLPAEKLFSNINEKNFPNENVLTIIQGKGTVLRTQSGRDILFDESRKNTYKKVQRNDFIIHLRSFEAGLEIANSNGIVSPAYTILRNKIPIATMFYRNYFRSNKFINQILRKAVEGIRDGKQISYSQFKKLPIIYASLDEQKKIANFLSTVDKKISNLEDIIINLEKQKKGLLQQIFNQELRFKDENDNNYPDWEKKKLGNLFTIKAGGDISKENFSEQYSTEFKYPVYANALTNDGLYGYSNIYKIDKPSITVTGRGINVGFALSRKPFYYPIVRLLVLIPNVNINFTFFTEAINFIHIFNESTGVPQLTAPQLSKVNIFVPTIKEQNKIGYLFDKLNKKIDNQKAQLEHWKQIKKGLLQQMFV